MATSRLRSTIAGAAALAIAAALMMVMSPSQAAPPENGFTCRASTVRTEGSSLAQLNLEPFVANGEDGACETDSAGILTDGEPVNLGTLGTVRVAYAETDATTNTAEAGVASADLLVGGIPIRATILTSTASGGTCPNPGLTGSSTIATVTVGNTTLAVPSTADDDPELVLPANLGSVYLNYQTTSRAGNDRVLTQRAVYIDVNQAVLPLVPDVIIAEAIADIHGNPCAGPPSSTTTIGPTTTTAPTTTTTTTVPDDGRCPAPSPEGNPETDDSPVDEDCGYGQPSGVTKRPKNR